ncbi:universal stress protein [Sediminibacterium roseum]|uniref:Universal stress protein n=1 Tax=Sediminibacterium roseum TaxID=1978412 RepID=A0ABW9ZY19_9BACT|nr:universal stress protein [Sediminibacterium roseum]NCI52064.1 universal stress protein [Sediminibacterium roseum]
MIKITLAINPFAPSKNALDFGAYLARITGSALTASILENKGLAEQQQHGNPALSVSPENMTGQTIKWFKEGATAREVSPKIHHNRGMPFTELIEESRFADVLVMHPAISFRQKFEGNFTQLTKDILRRSECPVFLTTETVEQVDEIIVAYDRSASSMFAVKLFIYLFPELSHARLSVLHVEPDAQSGDILKHHLKEWLSVHRHGPVNFVNLTGDTDKKLIEYLAGKKNAVLIMGGYKRSAGFRLRSKSYVEWIVKNSTLPVFITHR